MHLIIAAGKEYTQVTRPTDKSVGYLSKYFLSGVMRKHVLQQRF